MEREDTPRDGPTAVRLTFAIEGDDLELRNARRLSMRVPGGESVGTTERENRIGSWVEVRGPDDEVLYRRRIQQVIAEDVEVSEGGERGAFRRVPRGKSSGLVHVHVPEIDGAQTVALCERRPREGKEQTADVFDHATVPFARLDLDGDDGGEKGDGHDDDESHASGAR